jgi:predicted dinucleotide-binding enzyme
MSDISIIGSGNMASAIGALALKGGNAVEIVGRDAAKAAALVRALGDGATAGTWGAAPGGEIVILAVLFEGAVPVVSEYGDALDGKIEGLGLSPRDVGDLSMAHWLEGAGLLSVGLSRNGLESFSLGVNFG